MSNEDKYPNGIVVDQTMKAVEKKPKLSKEEVDAIFTRLCGLPKDSTQTTSSTSKDTIAISSKPITKKIPPYVPKKKEIAEDDEDDESPPTETVPGLLERRAPPAARDFPDWKRKNNVPPGTAKVFSMTGWYPCVKQALLDRGWYFNPDPSSQYFDLKWSLRSCEVSLDVLKPEQLTNHFCKNGAITTKVGLLRSLQSLNWFADVSSNDIIPRGYDLTNPQETLMFMDDFACQQAENVLKSIYYKATGKRMPDDEKLVHADEGPSGNTYDRPKTPRFVTAGESNGSGKNIEVNMGLFFTCCEMLERRIRVKESNDEYLDDKRDGTEDQPVTLLDWETIASIDTFQCGGNKNFHNFRRY